LGLAEMVDEGAVTVVEWGDAVAPALPREFLEVSLAHGDDDDRRTVALRAVGRRWSARAEALSVALSQWAVA
ncbi:MAG: hypothetical protein M3N25_06895, partial [Actinomycetota bacterium]|nr:hypothetical protein [Actinomycetota bacterium]